MERSAGLLEAVNDVRPAGGTRGRSTTLTSQFTQYGWTALHFAAINGQCSFVLWLFERCPQLVERVNNVRAAWCGVAVHRYE